MIAKLRGTLDSIGEDWLVVDVGGVGYLAYCSARTLGNLPAHGGAVELFVETHVREDHIHLYGFAETGERAWFRLLQTVQGVGAKVALGVLSVLGPGEISTAIAAQDRTALTRAPGIGTKVATRILTELKDKAPIEMAISAAPASAAGAANDGDGLIGEAVSALVNLGYGRSEAYAAVATVAREAEAGDLSAIIRAGLKELAP